MSALDKLIAAHPSLFRGAPPRVPSDLPMGWSALIDELCCGIERILGPEGCAKFEVTQIKEKFAGLRFYFALGGVRDRFMDLLSPEGTRTFVKIAEPSSPEMVEIRKLIAQAAKASRATCQECGAPGRPGRQGGWLATLCERHHAERSEGEVP